MSRLIIKNLPKKISDNELREKFEKFGAVTDIQLKFNKEGKFRQFAFVGFENEHHALEALNYYNKTFIGASRVSIEICKSLADRENVTLPHKVKSENTENTKDKSAKDIKLPENDEKLNEFLNLHKRSKSAVWLNDGISRLKAESDQEVAPQISNRELEVDDSDGADENDIEGNLARASISDKEYFKSKVSLTEVKESKPKKFSSLMTIKLSNLPCKISRKDIKQFFKPMKCKSIRIPVKAGFAYVGFCTSKDYNAALNKHNSILEGHQVRVKPHVEKKNIDDEPGKKKHAEVDCDPLIESGRIFIRNLSYQIKEDVIESLFSKYGQLTEVNLPVDKLTRLGKGFGFVTFMFPEDAVKAFAELDGSILQGRTLHLIPSENKNQTEVEDDGTFKSNRLKDLKAKASVGYNWNSLFLGGNAVAEALSKTYNVSKQEIFDPHAEGSAAVRMAIGETQLVNDIKTFLKDSGVNLDSFTNCKVRSKTVILVKNLPHETKATELQERFEKYGPLLRVVLHPSGLTGLVEYKEPSEARKAFSSLAYSRFKHLPIFLEWAPENVFITPAQASIDDLPHTVDKEKKEELEDEEEDEKNDEDRENKLFVKNLNFITTQESLIKHFSKVVAVKSANIAQKKDLKTGEQFSMGYGFVTFKSYSDCDHALKILQHSTLDERMIELKRSHSMALPTGKVIEKPKKNTKSSCKILVRNVPFQAVKSELQALFSPFGDIKSIRLPKKLEGSHRGFCFVEYASKKHAKKAMSILSASTHLYGRRLVLEWAESEEDLEAIRKRTAEHFASDLGSHKKAKGVADIVAKENSDSE